MLVSCTRFIGIYQMSMSFSFVLDQFYYIYIIIEIKNLYIPTKKNVIDY